MKKLLLITTLLLAVLNANAWRDMEMKSLHISGRYLCDTDGNHIRLHGFGQTYSPYFNGYAWCKDANGNVDWSTSAQYNDAKCVAWNEEQISLMLDKGWKVNWLRLHMDPHWSNDPAKVQEWKTNNNSNYYDESQIYAFDETRFKTYLQSVFIPMAKYAIDNGLYVVMRPPGVCPKEIGVGDSYHQYLLKVWKIVCSDSYLKNNPYIMFELANEPITMNDGSGNYTSWSDGSQKKCTEFFQQIVDEIRELGCNNILWVPGLSYQMNYQGYVKYPVTDTSDGLGIGYAVHCYPGWYGSDSESDSGSAEQGVVTKGAGYVEFRDGWNTNVGCIAANAPILITEMDWAPQKYNSSWGKATTGTEGGVGFGANFHFLMDKTGNVSWMLFTDADKLAQYDDNATDGETFLTDPEACPRPCYRWYQQYAADPDYSSYSEEREQQILDSIQAAKDAEKASKSYTLSEADEVNTAADDLNGKVLLATDLKCQTLLYVNSDLESPQNVRTGILDDASANPMCFFKFTRVTDASCTTTGNLYTIQMADQSGVNYSLWGKAGYLNTPPGEWCLFALGLTNGYGEDAQNYGLWKVDYEAGEGYTIQNVGVSEAGSGNSWLSTASATPVASKTYIRLFTKLTEKTSGIIQIGDETLKIDNSRYTISGQRIVNPRPGTLIISGGKKYICK